MKARHKRISLFSIFNYTFFVIVSLLMVFPLWNVVVISFTDYQEYVANPLMLFPENISLEAYRYIFANNDLLLSLRVTVTITLIGWAA